MLKWIIRRRLAGVERAYDYDMSYARDILDASLTAFRRFAGILSMANYHEDVPLAAWYAAKLAATLAEDCGPCTQFVATAAERAGVKPDVLRAVIAGDAAAMGEDAGLGFAFTRATLARDLAEADRLRGQVLRRWGERALVSLALAIAAARVFPTVKYALGHGRACSRVVVGGESVVPAHAALAHA
jgi:hypothetical protein